MSSTNKTANYELSQFVGTDIPSILGDYNGDMRKIDAAIGEVASSAGSSASAVSALSGRVTTVENNVQTLEGAQTVTNQRSVQNQVAITAIQGEIPDDASSENKLATKSDIPDVSGLASQSDLNTVSGKVDTIESIIPSSASTSNKLATMADVGGGGEPYVLPTATASRLGGVKIGSGINVESDGTISATKTRECILRQTVEDSMTIDQLGKLIFETIHGLSSEYDRTSVTVEFGSVSLNPTVYHIQNYSSVNVALVHTDIYTSAGNLYPEMYLFNCVSAGSELAEVSITNSGTTSSTITGAETTNFSLIKIFVDKYVNNFS